MSIKLRGDPCNLSRREPITLSLLSSVNHLVNVYNYFTNQTSLTALLEIVLPLICLHIMIHVNPGCLRVTTVARYAIECCGSYCMYNKLCSMRALVINVTAQIELSVYSLFDYSCTVTSE